MEVVRQNDTEHFLEVFLQGGVVLTLRPLLTEPSLFVFSKQDVKGDEIIVKEEVSHLDLAAFAVPNPASFVIAGSFLELVEKSYADDGPQWDERDHEECYKDHC